jgi:hypothetical protein
MYQSYMFINDASCTIQGDSEVTVYLQQVLNVGSYLEAGRTHMHIYDLEHVLHSLVP